MVLLIPALPRVLTQTQIQISEGYGPFIGFISGQIPFFSTGRIQGLKAVVGEKAQPLGILRDERT